MLRKLLHLLSGCKSPGIITQYNLTDAIPLALRHVCLPENLDAFSRTSVSEIALLTQYLISCSH